MRWFTFLSKHVGRQRGTCFQSHCICRRCGLENLEVRRLLTTNWLVDTLSDDALHSGLSLRDAINAAAGSTDDDVITFKSSLFDGQLHQINLQSSLTIGSFSNPGDITIHGPGANQLAINADGADSVFSFALNVASMYNVLIDGLSLTGASDAAINKSLPGVNSLTLVSDQIIENNGSAIRWRTGGELTVTNCTIANNQVTDASVLDLSQLGTASAFTNDTIAFNSSTGIAAGINVGYGTIALQNVTVANNHSDSQSEGIGVGLNLAAPCSVTLTNTIVAGNSTGGSAAADTGTSLTDGTASFTAASNYNLIGCDASGSFPSGTGNLIGTDPNSPINAELAPVLGYYGGTTQTLPLFDNSPAIDAGSPAALSSTDQRGMGFNREIDGTGGGNTRSDIGAFEAGNVNPIDNALTVLFHPGAMVTANGESVTAGGGIFNFSNASTLNLFGSGSAYTIAPSNAGDVLPSSINISDPTMTKLTLDFSATSDSISIQDQSITATGSNGGTTISYGNSSAGLAIIPGSGGTIISSGPVIINFKFEKSLGVWYFSGLVVDDESVAGLNVNFGGLLVGSLAPVEADGMFYLSVLEFPGATGTVTAKTADREGINSNEVSVLVS